MSPVFWKFRPRSPNFKVDAKIPAAANKSECVFIRPLHSHVPCPLTLTLGGRGEADITTSRMSVYLSDTGMIAHLIQLYHSMLHQHILCHNTLHCMLLYWLILYYDIACIIHHNACYRITLYHTVCIYIYIYIYISCYMLYHAWVCIS